MKTSPHPRERLHANERTVVSYASLRRRGVLHSPERPGTLLRPRASRLLHPSYRRCRPSDTGG